MPRLRIVLTAALLAVAPLRASTATDAPLPATLADTGLYAAGSTAQVREGVASFAPKYPLWTDGATKRRWIALPPGTAIDKTDVDAWQFPRGTKAWKEFSHAGRVETRLIERLSDGSWRYASYVWNAEGTEARLAPEDGMTIAKAGADGRPYTVPSRADCVACHEGAPAPLLGVSAVQLTPALAGLAVDDTTRTALGYLHANCGHCHNDAALPALDFVLAQSAADPQASAARALESLSGRSSRYRPQGQAIARHDAVIARMKSRDPLKRMPPTGVDVPDAQAIALLERWLKRASQPNQGEHR